MSGHHYTECGLDNAYIVGVGEFAADAGEGTITIPAMGQLHRVIAEGIVTQSSKMTGQELRFLRTEMGLTQSALGRILKVALLTVSRWERNDNPVSDAAEMLLRILAAETLNLKVKLGVRSLSALVSESRPSQEMRIDGSTPGNYRLLDAA